MIVNSYMLKSFIANFNKKIYAKLAYLLRTLVEASSIFQSTI